MSYTLSAVVAVDNNWGIGLNGKLLVTVSQDMKNFKSLTSGKTVIYGHKTLLTFPNEKPLPNRRNIIFSRNTNLKVEGAEIVHSIDELLSILEGDCFVIGGAQIYKLLYPYFDTVYLTRFDTVFESDAVFPELVKSEGWTECDDYRKDFIATEKDSHPGLHCIFLKYVNIFEREEKSKWIDKLGLN